MPVFEVLWRCILGERQLMRVQTEKELIEVERIRIAQSYLKKLTP